MGVGLGFRYGAGVGLNGPEGVVVGDESGDEVGVGEGVGVGVGLGSATGLIAKFAF